MSPTKTEISEPLQKLDSLPKNEKSISISSCHKQSEGVKNCPETPLCSACTCIWWQNTLNAGESPFITKAFFLDQGATVFGRTRACDVEKCSETDSLTFPSTVVRILNPVYLESNLTREMIKIISDKWTHIISSKTKPISLLCFEKLQKLIPLFSSTKHIQQQSVIRTTYQIYYLNITEIWRKHWMRKKKFILNHARCFPW